MSDRLSAFTPEQREAVNGLVAELLQEIERAKDLASETGQLLTAGLHAINTDLVALRSALMKRGVLAPAEINAAKTEVLAAFAVEEAVNPELRAAAETLEQLKRELGLTAPPAPPAE
jgi:hypothetical protein